MIYIFTFLLLLSVLFNLFLLAALGAFRTRLGHLTRRVVELNKCVVEISSDEMKNRNGRYYPSTFNPNKN